MTQEQIAEEVNRFQESFEELVRKIERVEGKQGDPIQKGVIDTLSSRVENLELEQ